MLNRFIRYSLLVLCLLVAGVWGWSCRHHDDFFYSTPDRTRGFFTNDGELVFLDTDRYPFQDEGFEFVGNPGYAGYREICPPQNVLFRFAGVMKVHFPEKPNRWLAKPTGSRLIVIPLWLLTILTFLPTAAFG